MDKLMLTFMSLVLLALPVDLISGSVENSKALLSNDTIVTSSHGGLRANEKSMAEGNTIIIKTDHSTLSAQLARKPRHADAFWDDFYNTATVSLWLSAAPKDTLRHKSLYNAYLDKPDDSAYRDHWHSYRQEHSRAPLSQRLHTQDYSEWLYIMYRIDLDEVFVDQSVEKP